MRLLSRICSLSVFLEAPTPIAQEQTLSVAGGENNYVWEKLGYSIRAHDTEGAIRYKCHGGARVTL